MPEADEIGRPLEWLHQWFDLSILGSVLHLDLKADNLYKESLIDWDNIILQFGRMSDCVMSDGTHYILGLGALDNEINNVFRLLGAPESHLFIYQIANLVYLVAKSSIDVELFMHRVVGLPVDSPIRLSRPSVTEENASIWQRLSEVTLVQCDCELSALQALPEGILPRYAQESLEEQSRKCAELWRRYHELLQ